MSAKLVPCRACGEDIGKGAMTCPKCGQVNWIKEPKKVIIKVLLVIGGIWVFFTIAHKSQFTGETDEKRKEREEREMREEEAEWERSKQEDAEFREWYDKRTNQPK